MESFNEISKYKDIKGKMVYTFLIYSTTCDQIKTYLHGLIDKISTIKDNYKKKIANERIKSFELYFENFKLDQSINSVFLVGENNFIKQLSLDKNHIKTLVDFKISNTHYFCDDYYLIDHFIKILDETKLITVCSIDNTNATIISMDEVKNRIVQQTNLESGFEKYNCELYYGLSNQLNGLIKKYPTKKIFSGKLTKEEVWNKIIKDKNIISQEKFNNEVLTQLINPGKENIFIFGKKEVGNEILNYGVKKLFITSKLYNNMMVHIDKSLLNFEIVILEKNSEGDFTDILIKNFGGLVGIKYF